MKLLIFLVLCFGTQIGSSTLNNEPIIGILTQQLSKALKAKYPDYHSYIASSYVKFIESAGARVVPIWYDEI